MTRLPRASTSGNAVLFQNGSFSGIEVLALLSGHTNEYSGQIVPGGNLGNSSAFGKAFLELKELGLIKRIPRLAVINASGANTLHQLYGERGEPMVAKAEDWGGKFFVTDEARSRNKVAEFDQFMATFSTIGSPTSD